MNTKNTLLSICLWIISATLMAQAPQKLNYQAVARDASGLVLNNKTVKLRLTVHSGSATGTIVYQETQSSTSNNFGVLSLRIGEGTVVQGSMAGITWATTANYLQVEMDPNNGTSFIDMGASELVSVPYALFAASGNQGPQGIQGIPGPQGLQGIQGPPGTGSISGTTNYVLKFTDPTTGGNSQIFDDGNNIGIGTANPAAKLDVQGGNIALNSNELRLGTGGDGNHILAYDPIIDGPRLSGFSGGVLGGTSGTGDVLRWTWDGFNGRVGIGTNAPDAIFTVKGSGGYAGNHIALFENTDGANADGIAIKIDNATTDKENNFVTFLNQNGDVKGRIEGFNLSTDWLTPPVITTLPAVGINYNFSPGSFPTLNPGIWPLIIPGTWPTINSGTWPTVSVDPPSTTISFTTYTNDLDGNGPLPGFTYVNGINAVDISSFNATVTGGSWGSLSGGSFGTLGGGSWGSLSGGSFPSLSFNASNPFSISLPSQSEAQSLACWAIENGVNDMISLDAFSAATQSLKETVIQACKDGGVTYGSHGADYAEYIEKADHTEYIQGFDVVGIKGGMVSRKTEGAEQIMIVSTKPVVLGNTPKESEEKNYVTCGFMGQLPCVVRGLCHKGDFILASGLNDGTAIAVTPENLTVDMLSRIVGRAWGEQTNEIYGLVNVAIGLKTNEWVNIMKTQESKINAMSADIDMLKTAIGIKVLQPASNSTVSTKK